MALQIAGRNEQTRVLPPAEVVANPFSTVRRDDGGTDGDRMASTPKGNAVKYFRTKNVGWIGPSAMDIAITRCLTTDG